MSWDDVEKKIIMGEEEYHTYIQVSSKLAFIINILCNIRALTLFSDCNVYVNRRTPKKRFISIKQYVTMRRWLLYVEMIKSQDLLQNWFTKL